MEIDMTSLQLGRKRPFGREHEAGGTCFALTTSNSISSACEVPAAARHSRFEPVGLALAGQAERPRSAGAGGGARDAPTARCTPSSSQPTDEMYAAELGNVISSVTVCVSPSHRYTVAPRATASTFCELLHDQN
jgi:hypothetical protein